MLIYEHEPQLRATCGACGSTAARVLITFMVRFTNKSHADSQGLEPHLWSRWCLRANCYQAHTDLSGLHRHVGPRLVLSLAGHCSGEFPLPPQRISPSGKSAEGQSPPLMVLRELPALSGQRNGRDCATPHHVQGSTGPNGMSMGRTDPDARLRGAILVETWADQLCHYPGPHPGLWVGPHHHLPYL